MSAKSTKVKTVVLSIPVGEIINMEPSLATVSQIHGLPVKTTYRLSRFITKIRPVIEQFNKDKLELLRKVGTENPETPGNFNIPSELQDTFLAELKVLTDEIFEIPNWLPLTLNDFSCTAGIEITAMQFSAISPLITDEADEENEENENENKNEENKEVKVVELN